jgi:hypothetical protein
MLVETIEAVKKYFGQDEKKNSKEKAVKRRNKALIQSGQLMNKHHLEHKGILKV